MLSCVAQYHKRKVGTLYPDQLMVIVYDSIIMNLNGAIEGMSHHRYFSAYWKILLAQNAFSKLLIALNIAEGCDFALNHSKLFAYFKKQLREASLLNDEKKVRSVIKLMGKLREAWSGTINTSAHSIYGERSFN